MKISGLYNNSFTKAWIGGSCNPSEKGMLTTFPRLSICQHNIKSVSNMLKFEDLPEINSERWLSLEDLEGEVWRDVVGYESLFQISSYGRLKRKARLSYNPHNKTYCSYKEKIIRNQTKVTGYQHACLCIGFNQKVNLSFHRLVMEAFVPNPNNLPFINHKDENPRNNCIYLLPDGSLDAEKSNLEWCTAKYNSNYGTIKNKLKQAKIHKGYAVSVVLYEYNGCVIEEFETMVDAAEKYNVSRELISLCCKGEISSANGLHFRYKGEEYVQRKCKQTKNKYFVYKDGVLLFSTQQTKELSKKLGVDYSSLRRLFKYNKKHLRKLEDYVIEVHTQYGNKYKIINGEKVIW